MKLISILIVICAAHASLQNAPNEWKTWRLMEWKLPANTNTAGLNAANAIPIDVAVDYRGKNLIFEVKFYLG